MTGKHYRWQTAWRLHAGAQLHTATHDSGLEVEFDTAGRASARNAAQVLQTLAVRNGPHNAPRMVQRLIREAEQLYRSQAHVRR